MKVAPEILSLVPYKPGKPIAETKREFGLDRVIKLASNECPLPPPAGVLDAIARTAHEINRYPDGSSYEMRQQVASYYDVDPSWLAFGNGSDELVELLVRIYCEPGDEIVTSKSAFIAYKISAQGARLNTVEVPLREDWGFDLKAIAAEIQARPKTRLVFLPNPNNPTGRYFTKAEFDEFLTAIAERDILVVLDEAYVEFVRAKDYPSGTEYLKNYPQVCLLRTMSKVFGLAGLRVGTLLARPEVVDLVNRIRKPFNINAIAQAAVSAVLRETEFLKSVQQLTWDGLDYYTKELERLQLDHIPSQGNFVLFDTGRDADAVFTELLKMGVILRPVKNYGLPRHLRMSVGLSEENRQAIAAIEKVLGRTGTQRIR